MSKHNYHQHIQGAFLTKSTFYGAGSGKEASALNPVELGPVTYSRDDQETACDFSGERSMGSAQETACDFSG